MNTKEKPVKDPAGLAGSIREARIRFGLSPFPCSVKAGKIKASEPYEPPKLKVHGQKRPD